MKPETKTKLMKFGTAALAVVVGLFVYDAVRGPVMSIFQKGTSMVAPPAPAPKA